MMSGDEESRSFTAYSDALMGYLTYYEGSCCASSCVTSRVYVPCERACDHECK